MNWMETKDRPANNGIQEKVMEKNYDIEDDLDTIQRNIETAAGEVAHHTKAERDQIIMSTPKNVMSDNVRNPLRDALQRSKGKYSRNKPGKPGRSTK